MVQSSCEAVSQASAVTSCSSRQWKQAMAVPHDDAFIQASAAAGDSRWWLVMAASERADLLRSWTSQCCSRSRPDSPPEATCIVERM